MKSKIYLVNFILIFTLVLSCNKKSHIEIKSSTKKAFQFTEIGLKDIAEVKFPDYWDTQSYNNSEAPTMIKEAIYFDEKLNKLDYFNSVKGRLIKSKFYNNFIAKKNQQIDSLFILDSISHKDVKFVYIKSYKTEKGNYDWSPTFQEIDLLIFSKSKFKEKVNIYSCRNYPYFVGTRLGYLNHRGTLYIKEFDTDEEKTTFVKEEQMQISEDGNTKLIFSHIKYKRNDDKSNIKKSSINLNSKTNASWKGSYTITTKAISQYDNKEFDLLYIINMKSNNDAILSIGAEHSEDYWCEGNYKLTLEDDILHARGKCDQDDLNDFYLKQEDGKYYIKSKQFLNPDWQILKRK